MYLEQNSNKCNILLWLNLEKWPLNRCHLNFDFFYFMHSFCTLYGNDTVDNDPIHPYRHISTGFKEFYKILAYF